MINTDILQGKWKQLQGSAKTTWGKITDDELEQVSGDGEKLIGLVQEKYGLAREEAKTQVDNWFNQHDFD